MNAMSPLRNRRFWPHLPVTARGPRGPLFITRVHERTEEKRPRATDSAMGLSAVGAGTKTVRAAYFSRIDLPPLMFDPGFAVPVAFFATIAYIAKLIGDTRIRRKALESPVSDEMAEAVVNRRWTEPSTRSALKWGLVILSLGAGMLLVDLLSITFESPVAYAILMFAAGGALIGYYLIEHDATESLGTASASVMDESSASEPVRDPEL